MNTVTVTISSSWPSLIAAILLPGYIIATLATKRVKQLWGYVIAVIIFAGLAALSVGIHPAFNAVTFKGRGLTLVYPWPRQNVQLASKDIKSAALETRNFGVLQKRRVRLRISSADGDFYSLWCAGNTNLLYAKELILEEFPQLSGGSDK